MGIEECQFIAEQSLITFVPNFNAEEEEFSSAGLIKFEAGLPVEIPIWMASILKARSKGSIVAPEWLNPQTIEQYIQSEKEQFTFTMLPDNFFCISLILINKFKNDIENIDTIKILIQDLWDKRLWKMRSSLVKFFVQKNMCHVRINNITLFESCYIGPIIYTGTKSLDDIRKMLDNLATTQPIVF
uniref:GINS complex subunit 2 n=1 Tax=Strongyloides venezuelensis TaxID=75913 RepID=A0A0K0FHB5_STRVS